MGFFKDILSGRWRKRQDERKSRDAEKAGNFTAPVPPAPGRSKGEKTLFGILRASRLTEKSSAGAAGGVYTFIVSQDAAKSQIAQAVGQAYDVEVESVRTLHLPGKQLRRGRQIGWKAGFKKAMVRLKEGQTIDVQ